MAFPSILEGSLLCRFFAGENEDGPPGAVPSRGDISLSQQSVIQSRIHVALDSRPSQKIQWDRSNYLSPNFPIPNRNLSLAEILIHPFQDTRGKLDDNFDLYPPKTQPSQNSSTPRGLPVHVVSRPSQNTSHHFSFLQPPCILPCLLCFGEAPTYTGLIIRRAEARSTSSINNTTLSKGAYLLTLRFAR